MGKESGRAGEGAGWPLPTPMEMRPRRSLSRNVRKTCYQRSAVDRMIDTSSSDGRLLVGIGERASEVSTAVAARFSLESARCLTKTLVGPRIARSARLGLVFLGCRYLGQASP